MDISNRLINQNLINELFYLANNSYLTFTLHGQDFYLNVYNTSLYIEYKYSTIFHYSIIDNVITMVPASDNYIKDLNKLFAQLIIFCVNMWEG